MKKVMLILFMIMTLISNPILVSAGSYYQVDGDSMNPIFNDGDTIQIVSEFYEDGDMVVAQLKDGRKIVKRLMGDRIVSVGHGTSYPVSEVTILGTAEYVPMSMEELERYGFSWESVLAEGETITQIASGWAHSLALTNTGVVYAWGAGGGGRLGNGADTQQTTPVKVLDGAIEGGNSGVTAISAGENFSLALKGGVVYSWGANFSGQLGSGNNDHQNTPIKVLDGTMTNSGVTAISAGGNHSLAIKDGEVYAWGYNTAGQLGNGERFNQNIPIKVSDGAMNNSGVTAISAGQDHSLAIKGEAVYAWGGGFCGQLGNEAYTEFQTTPVKVSDGGIVGGNSGVTAISAGGVHSLAIKEGVVYAWGSGANGQLGSGSTSTQTTPVKVSDGGIVGGNSGVTAISAGGSHSLALKVGKAYAWGSGEFGRLGNGANIQQDTPVEVSPGEIVGGNSGVTAISAGGQYSLALKGGEVYAWGTGANGRLGNGAVDNHNTPVATNKSWIPIDTTINIAAIPGVTAPVRTATPVTTITVTDQYTGTVTWNPAHNPFGASTVYTATITLTPKAGFTLTGVTENFFTVAGATATNAANNGVVTAVFPATGAAPDTPINIAAIPGVTAPVRTATPVTTITETDQYTGTVAWNPAHNPFGASTVYTATITLTPKAGFTLTGVTENFFTVAGATATNAANNGVVTAVFPATGAAPDTPINIAAIPGVTAPVRTATPVTTITETDQYTGTVAWNPAHNPFGASTVYTATITLTPKAGFTLTGVAENYFTVAGATATNAANTGVITAVFPATGAAPPPLSGDDGGSWSPPTTPPASEPVIVIVNNKAEDAGTRTDTEENGKTTTTIEVNNNVIESKIEEAIQNNPTGVGNKIQVPVIGTQSQQIKVALTGDIVKKLENNNFNVSIKRDSVDYIIPAKEFTISGMATLFRTEIIGSVL